MEFNTIDFIVGGLIIVLGLKGMLNGMVKEVFGLLAIAGGIFLASSYAADIGVLIDATIYSFEKVEIATLIGFIALLVVSWGGIILLGNLFSKLVKLSLLGAVDRIFGVIFASGKIFIIFAIIAYSISSIEVIAKSFSKHTDGSFLYPILVESGSLVLNIDTDMFDATVLQDSAPQRVESESLSLEDLQKEIAQRMDESAKQLEKLEKRVKDE